MRILSTILIGLAAILCVGLSAVSFLGLVLSWFLSSWWYIALDLALLAAFTYGFWTLSSLFVKRIEWHLKNGRKNYC